MNYRETPSGVLVSEADFREPTATPVSLATGEIATTLDGRDITRGYVDNLPILPPQDSVLQARGGGNYQIYDEVLRDDQVRATLQQRWGIITSAEMEVQPGGNKRADKAAADMMKEYLSDVNSSESALERTTAMAPMAGFDQVIHSMLYGEFYGHGVAECMWRKDGRHIGLDGIKVRKARRFGFTPKGELRLFTANNMMDGEALPARKFWSYSVHSDNTDDPYGLGLAHWLYWPVFFKRNGLKFWLIFLEKFGQPTAVGRYPGATATPTEKQKLLSALRAITTDSGIIMPAGMEVELLEASRSGTADYSMLYKTMNEMIAKVVVGQTQTIENVGGSNKADVQQDALMSIAKATSDIIHTSFNRTAVKWLTQWNYPNAKTPIVTRRLDDDEDLDARSARDKTIYDMGYKPTTKYINETYGGEWEERTLPVQAPVVNDKQIETEITEFAESLDTEVDDLRQQLAQVSQEPLESLVRQYKTSLDTVKTLAEFSELLHSKNKHKTPDELALIMQYGMAMAEARGRQDVTTEAE